MNDHVYLSYRCLLPISLKLYQMMYFNVICLILQVAVFQVFSCNIFQRCSYNVDYIDSNKMQLSKFPYKQLNCFIEWNSAGPGFSKSEILVSKLWLI